MKDFSSLKQALKLASIELETSPLAPNSKIPLLKGGNGYLDATSDKAILNKMFSNCPQANLCLRLDTSHLIMVDVDLHTEQANGFKTLTELNKKGMKLTDNTYIESTPHDGLHYYFKAEVPIHDISKAFSENSGVEIHTRFSSVYPSEIDGKQYEPLDGRTLADIKPAPKWLVDKLVGQKVNWTSEHAYTTRLRLKKYTGRLLDEMVQGTNTGDRNVWLTKMIGRLFVTGAEPETVYELACSINERFIDQPLETKEVTTIYNSILKREMKRFERNSIRNSKIAG
ncbi:DNA replication protein [Pediococcus damnosus LMG 28219]|uniref:bifunctional DNA primase/polymerase n=1 Tax=Pediococcus damnosus TaxID=51663 RepID=UPI00061F65EF|nr:bifunctional DNA primase/polymerase [Pediococcus damnosus]KJU75100.1 DNA replication protein [Pediococcus damnosus LMG 28219]